MSKWLNPGMYSASLTGVWIDDLEAGGCVVTNMELDLGELEKRILAYASKRKMSIEFGYRQAGKLACAVHPELLKLMKAQPTKPVHSHEPWKQSVKRQGRQIGKSK